MDKLASNTSMMIKYISQNKYSYIEKLLQKNIRCDIVDKVSGLSPLHFIIGLQSELFAKKFLSIMIEQGNEINTRSHSGTLPIHIAAANGKYDLLHLLLNHGPDLISKDEEDMNVLENCEFYHHSDCIRLVKDYITNNDSSLLNCISSLHNTHIYDSDSYYSCASRPEKISYPTSSLTEDEYLFTEDEDPRYPKSPSKSLKYPHSLGYNTGLDYNTAADGQSKMKNYSACSSPSPRLTSHPRTQSSSSLAYGLDHRQLRNNSPPAPSDSPSPSGFPKQTTPASTNRSTSQRGGDAFPLRLTGIKTVLSRGGGHGGSNGSGKVASCTDQPRDSKPFTLGGPSSPIYVAGSSSEDTADIAQETPPLQRLTTSRRKQNPTTTENSRRGGGEIDALDVNGSPSQRILDPRSRITSSGDDFRGSTPPTRGNHSTTTPYRNHSTATPSHRNHSAATPPHRSHSTSKPPHRSHSTSTSSHRNHSTATPPQRNHTTTSPSLANYTSPISVLRNHSSSTQPRELSRSPLTNQRPSSPLVHTDVDIHNRGQYALNRDRPFQRIPRTTDNSCPNPPLSSPGVIHSSLILTGDGERVNKSSPRSRANAARNSPCPSHHSCTTNASITTISNRLPSTASELPSTTTTVGVSTASPHPTSNTAVPASSPHSDSLPSPTTAAIVPPAPQALDVDARRGTASPTQYVYLSDDSQYSTTRQIRLLDPSSQVDCSVVKPEPLKNNEFSGVLTSTLRSKVIESFTRQDLSGTEVFSQTGKKHYFNYLLLDPRITDNFLHKSSYLSKNEQFLIFCRSIFYIGKGLKNRPYHHLQEAKKVYGKILMEKKFSRIHEIWQKQLGVICLMVYQNITSYEAHNREACMIQAIDYKLANGLTNQQYGHYYDNAKSFTHQGKCKMGVKLLLKAYGYLRLDGEIHLTENDV